MQNRTLPRNYLLCEAIWQATYPAFEDAGRIYEKAVAAVMSPVSCVLDIGCGRTSLASGAIRRGAFSAGIDLKLSDLAHNISLDALLMADAGRLPFPSSHFDVLTSQWVLEHIARPDAVFAEMARVLKPGGSHVFLTTNAWNYIPVISRLIPRWLQPHVISRLLHRPEHESFPTYYSANTYNAVSRHADRHGLEVVSCVFVGYPFYIAFSVPLFWLAVLFEKLTDRAPLNRLKLYLVVTLRKPS